MDAGAYQVYGSGGGGEVNGEANDVRRGGTEGPRDSKMQGHI